MKLPRVRLTVRRLMAIILAIACSIALALPAIRILRNRAMPHHHHILMSQETGEVVIWYHANSFFRRYLPELLDQVRSDDRVCERNEERRRTYPGFSELDASYNSTPLIEKHWFLNTRDQHNLIRVLKQFKMEDSASGELRRQVLPDLIDETMQID